MKRFHLFEIAEQSWCPRVIRDGLTDYLRWAIDVGDAYGVATPVLAELLVKSQSVDVVDLGAGGGGPWNRLRPALRARGVDVHVRLTDAAPNLSAFARAELASSGAVQGDSRSIDARHVPPDLRGVRTMFSVFHHFAPADARAILADALAHRTPIAVFEATRRDARAILVTLLVPLLVLVGTPMIRPFRWSRLFWTYVLPAIPIIALWDGVVSCLRTYSVGELRELTASIVTPDDWTWQTFELAGRGPIPVTAVVGASHETMSASAHDSRTVGQSR